MARRFALVLCITALWVTAAVPAGASGTATSVFIKSSLGGDNFSCAPPPMISYCPPPVFPGRSVTVTARVAPQGGGGVPTGTVTFSQGGTALATISLDANGTASYVVASASQGFFIGARYNGDGTFDGSDSQSDAFQPAYGGGSTYTPSSSGYVLDGWGGLHPWAVQGSGIRVTPVAWPSVPPTTPYWRGWNIARGVAIDAFSNSCSAEVDGWGGLHVLTWPVSPLPHVVGGAYWPGWDIVRDIILMPGCTGGYVLDGWGALHPFGLDHAPPPTVTAGPYWRGWDIARAAVILPDGSGGYIFDGWGGAHAFGIGGAASPPPVVTPYFPGQDIMRGATLINRFGIVLVDEFGGTYSGARAGTVPPAVLSPAHWNWPIADGIAAFGT